MEHSDVHSVTPQDQGSTVSLILIGIIIIVALGLIVGVVGYLALTTGTNNLANNSTNSTDQTTDQNEPFIQILTPKENEIVNGKILVTGAASSDITLIKVELIDSENNRLALSNVSISGTAGVQSSWQATLDVIASPAAGQGKIVVTSADPILNQQVDIRFEEYQTSPENLKISAPLKDQVMFSNNLIIYGEAKGLFEGVLNLRLRDESDNIIYEDSVTIPDQLEVFREFSYELTIDNLSSAEGETGTWEFFFLSAVDGSEVILQTIPIRFL